MITIGQKWPKNLMLETYFLRFTINNRKIDYNVMKNWYYRSVAILRSCRPTPWPPGTLKAYPLTPRGLVQGSLLLILPVGSLLLKYSNFQQIYKNTQPILLKLRSDQMDPKSALGGPKPISRTGGLLLKN